MLNGNSMYIYFFWELIYFYVICIYVIWETTINTLRLNKYFASIGPLLSSKLRQASFNCPEVFINKTMVISPTDEAGVKNVLEQMKYRKWYGRNQQ